jgi:uncharacterized protein YndB with AHSA1/START domain
VNETNEANEANGLGEGSEVGEATLVVGGDLPGVRLERVLPDPPDVVWRALTEPDELARWFPCGVEVEGWCVGATIRFPFPKEVLDVTLDGEVLECEPPHLLAYRWGDEVLRFELHGVDNGTRLVLVNELPGSRAARNAAGWDVCLARLAGAVPADGAWRTLFANYGAAFTPRLGAQEGPPAGHAAP